MYRWKDSDVRAILGLVTRSLCSADSVEESLRQLLQELSGALHAEGWVFESGMFTPSCEQDAASSLELPEVNQWQKVQSLMSENGAVHSCLGADQLGRYPCYMQKFASQIAVAERDCLIDVTNCKCLDREATHPVIACLWCNGKRQTRCLEYSRGIGQPPFTDRDQAILRVLARQLEQVAAGAGGLTAKNHSRHGLSPRQREVLELLLVGKNCKQIAAELRLSVYTVNDYIKAIYRRYEVSCRAELLAAVHIGA